MNHQDSPFRRPDPAAVFTPDRGDLLDRILDSGKPGTFRQLIDQAIADTPRSPWVERPYTILHALVSHHWVLESEMDLARVPLEVACSGVQPTHLAVSVAMLLDRVGIPLVSRGVFDDDSVLPLAIDAAAARH